MLDPDTGNDPARQSTDGEGLTAEELARRAEEKAARQAQDAALMQAPEAQPVAAGYAETVGSGGGSIRSRADALGDDDGEEQAELFPLGQIVGDPKLRIQDIKKLIGNKPVGYEVKLAQVPVPVEGAGLLDPREFYRYVITILPGDPSVKWARGKEKASTEINGITVVQNARVTYIEPLETREAEIRASFGDGPSEAEIRADERAKVMAEYGLNQTTAV